MIRKCTYVYLFIFLNTEYPLCGGHFSRYPYCSDTSYASFLFSGRKLSSGKYAISTHMNMYVSMSDGIRVIVL